MEQDELILQSQNDEQALAALVRQNERFILKIAAVTCRRYLTIQDDEWAVALQGFVQAVQGFQPEKGSFFAFAQVVIRRRLTDYLRTQAKYTQEYATDPGLFDDSTEEENSGLPLCLAVMQQARGREEDSLRLEIEAANEVLSHYGFSFFDLVECSPKAGKTKDACTRAVVCLLKNPPLMVQMQRSKQLPAKILEKNAKVPQKILDRHRKYIIAAAELLSGEYPCLADYMRSIREELEK